MKFRQNQIYLASKEDYLNLGPTSLMFIARLRLEFKLPPLISFDNAMQFVDNSMQFVCKQLICQQRYTCMEIILLASVYC